MYLAILSCFSVIVRYYDEKLVQLEVTNYLVNDNSECNNAEYITNTYNKIREGAEKNNIKLFRDINNQDNFIFQILNSDHLKFNQLIFDIKIIANKKISQCLKQYITQEEGSLEYLSKIGKFHLPKDVRGYIDMNINQHKKNIYILDSKNNIVNSMDSQIKSSQITRFPNLNSKKYYFTSFVWIFIVICYFIIKPLGR